MLPKAVREQLRWKAGTRLLVETRPDGVVLRPVETKKKLTVADLRGILKYKGPRRSLEEMDAAIVAEARRRFARGRH